MSLQTVFVFAPQGSGKSRHAEALRSMFGCTVIVDDWDGISEVPSGALVLSNIDPRSLDGGGDQ